MFTMTIKGSEYSHKITGTPYSKNSIFIPDIFFTSIEIYTMDTKNMMVCALVMMALITTSCKARYNDDDSEGAKDLDTRQAIYDALFKRGFAKRQVDSFSITLH